MQALRTHEYSVADLLHALERMHRESPEGVRDLCEWISFPTHTQSVTLRFREGRLQAVELTRVSR